MRASVSGVTAFYAALILGIYSITVEIPYLLERGHANHVPPEGRGGSAILVHRVQAEQGSFGQGADFLIAGSSRAMADFSPSTISAVIERGCGRRLRGYNLGNVANRLLEFSSRLQVLPVPKLLILEVAPHALLAGAPAAKAGSQQESYLWWRLSVKVFEATLVDWMQKGFSWDDRLRFSPTAIRVLARQRQQGAPWRDAIHLAAVVSGGFGQRLMEDGQVLYRVFLNGPGESRELRPYVSEYEQYQVQLASIASPASGLTAARAIAAWARSTDVRVVVVRAPVAPELYALENSRCGDSWMQFLELLREAGLGYIDLNPSRFSSADMSHVDWFDTTGVSRQLAACLLGSPHARSALCGTSEAGDPQAAGQGSEICGSEITP